MKMREVQKPHDPIKVETPDVKKQIFDPVALRVRDRADSLRPFVVFPRNGIEGWFKVETVAALHNSGVSIKVRNKGPDLLIGNLSIELKAATNFEASYILGGVKKYRDKYPSLACLFLGRHPNPTNCREKLTQDPNVQLVGYKAFSDGEHDWIIGLVAPCHYTV
jgi:hypothetical protein